MNIIDNIVVSVYTGEKFYNNRAKSIKDTWGKHFKNLYFHGCTEDNNLPVKILEYDSINKENYLSCFYKCLLGLEDAYKSEPNGQWYYSCGCDTFCHPENLNNILKNYDSNDKLFIGGHFGYYKINDYEFLFGSGGSGIILSNGLMKLLKNNWSKMIKEGEDSGMNLGMVDVIIAYFLYKNFNIKLTILDGFYHLNYPNYNLKTSKIDLNKNIFEFKNISHHSFPLIKNPIAFHYIQPGEMYNLYKNANLKLYPFN